ncbi:MAG: RNA methyltransferase [Candidatus Syntrophosphaera sp.]|nr:RNA methyltransferase [Candidatus Syntrophosphaera sp.]
MKPLISYSQRKFQALDAPGRIKALNKLLTALETVLGDPACSSPLLSQIRLCIGWMEKPLPQSVLRLANDLGNDPDPHQISQAITRFQGSLGLTFKDGQIAVLKGDGLRVSDPAAKERAQNVIVILDNLRSVFNIGSIFRGVECLAIKEIWLCGVSATPAHPALEKTARGTANRVSWRYFERTPEAIETAKAAGYHLYALETTQNSQSVFKSDYRFPLALVLGNESLGISEEVLALCAHQVSLPVQGWKNSLNVAVAFSVCAYQIVFGPGPAEQGGNNG